MAAAISVGYPFVALSTLLYVPGFGPAAIVAFIGAVAFAAYYIYRTDPLRLRWQWPSLLFGLVCAASTLWSIDPLQTLRSSAQVLCTLAGGVMIGIMPRPRHAVSGVFLALLLYAILSLLFGEYTTIGNHGALAFGGLYGVKNWFAAMLGLLPIFAVGVPLLSRRRRPLLVAVAAATLLLSIYGLAISRSATATIGAVVACAAVYLVAILSTLRPSQRTGLFLAALIVIAPIALVRDTVVENVMQGILTEFNKSPTLTGRTDIWETADGLIARRPLLGRGFDTFWVPHNPLAQRLWDENHIESRKGFSFHNTPREILVAVGWAGFSIIALTAIVLILILFWSALFLPAPYLPVWVGLIVVMLARASVDSFFPVGFATETTLIVAAFAVGLERLRTTRVSGDRSIPARPAPRPQREDVRPGRRAPHYGRLGERSRVEEEI